jgi:hypothetical protein
VEEGVVRNNCVGDGESKLVIVFIVMLLKE